MTRSGVVFFLNMATFEVVVITVVYVQMFVCLDEFGLNNYLMTGTTAPLPDHCCADSSLAALVFSRRKWRCSVPLIVHVFTFKGAGPWRYIELSVKH